MEFYNFAVLKLPNHNAGSNSNFVRKFFNRGLVSRPAVQESAQFAWRYEKRGCEFMCLSFLFLRRVVPGIVDKDVSLPVKQDVPRFVEESVPELIVAFISTA